MMLLFEFGLEYQSMARLVQQEKKRPAGLHLQAVLVDSNHRNGSVAFEWQQSHKASSLD